MSGGIYFFFFWFSGHLRGCKCPESRYILWTGSWVPSSHARLTRTDWGVLDFAEPGHIGIAGGRCATDRIDRHCGDRRAETIGDLRDLRQQFG